MYGPGVRHHRRYGGQERTPSSAASRTIIGYLLSTPSPSAAPHTHHMRALPWTARQNAHMPSAHHA